MQYNHILEAFVFPTTLDFASYDIKSFMIQTIMSKFPQMMNLIFKFGSCRKLF